MQKEKDLWRRTMDFAVPVILMFSCRKRPSSAELVSYAEILRLPPFLLFLAKGPNQVTRASDLLLWPPTLEKISHG
jgi:hypothetical protein